MIRLYEAKVNFQSPYGFEEDDIEVFHDDSVPEKENPSDILRAMKQDPKAVPIAGSKSGKFYIDSNDFESFMDSSCEKCCESALDKIICANERMNTGNTYVVFPVSNTCISARHICKMESYINEADFNYMGSSLNHVTSPELEYYFRQINYAESLVKKVDNDYSEMANTRRFQAIHIISQTILDISNSLTIIAGVGGVINPIITFGVSIALSTAKYAFQHNQEKKAIERCKELKKAIEKLKNKAKDKDMKDKLNNAILKLDSAEDMLRNSGKPTAY